MPPKVDSAGVLVRRTKVFDDDAGSAVKNTCDARCGLRPVASSACVGNVPSVLKFIAEAKTRLPGASDEL